MFIWDYSIENSWHNRIVPYSPLELDPACTVFHYGQAVFEGMKAYRGRAARCFVPPEMNIARLNRSNERMSIPQIDEKLALEAIKELVALERDWIPSTPGPLYISAVCDRHRHHLGVHPSATYKFIVILSRLDRIQGRPKPCQHLRGTSLCAGGTWGTGFAKAAGNYAGSLLAQSKAQSKDMIRCCGWMALNASMLRKLVP